MWLEPTYRGVNWYWDPLMGDEFYVIFVISPTYALVSSDWDWLLERTRGVCVSLLPTLPLTLG